MKESKTPRSVVIALICAAALGVLGLIAASPLALIAFDPQDDKKWQILSNIGQTYGAVSALISGLAITGVIISIMLQTRENKMQADALALQAKALELQTQEMKASRLQNERAHYAELLKMAIQDPTLFDAWGGPDPTRSVDERRQHMYINLILLHFEATYEIEELNDAAIAQTGDEIFAGEIGRSFWKRSRNVRARIAETPRAKHFHEILDERYCAALKTPPRGGSPKPETPKLIHPDDEEVA